MKIGRFVQTKLTEMFRNQEISKQEVVLMQTKEYSKNVFDIQYPLLMKATLSCDEKIPRYWKNSVEIYSERYYICSEWYEVPQNDDRKYFMKWLTLHKC